MAEAARTFLLGVTPSQRADIDAAFASSLAQIPDPVAGAEGVVIGSWIGRNVLACRSQDTSWRPQAAIRAGAKDGNPDTAGDSSRTSLRLAPAHPDYPAAHPTSGGAASTVLASTYGDATSFSLTTKTAPGGAVRSLTSFSQAANTEPLICGVLSLVYDCGASTAPPALRTDVKRLPGSYRKDLGEPETAEIPATG
jgi:hypothetical protein